MPSKYPKGSEWRRWDLHVHTPSSTLHNEFISWESYLHAIEQADSEVYVIGVTDYASIDGYKRLDNEKRTNTRLPKVHLLVPNIEFRISPFTKQGNAINLHILIDPSEPDHIDRIEDALSRFTFVLNKQKYPCTRRGLADLGKVVNPAIKDEEAAYREGVKQFKPDFDVLKVWHENEGWLKQNSLVAISNSSNDGASGLNHDDGYKAKRQEIYRFSNIVFSGNPNDRIYFLGSGADSKKQLEKKIGGQKPCVHGSDAHKEDRLFKPDYDRYCWIKSDPTFEGLRQILFEPEDRVHIGKTFPDSRDENRIIKSIHFRNANGWFADVELPTNPALVSVIGSKGSGKTALVDLIAYATGSWEQNPNSFIQKAHKEILGTEIVVNWVGGTPDTKKIEHRLESGKERKARYLSQQFVEQLCSEDKVGTELVEEIEQVIFEYLEDTEKLGHTTFSDLRAAKTASIREQKIRLRTAIVRLNDEIQNLNSEIRSKPEKKERITELENEKSGLEKQKPIFESVHEQQVEEQLGALREQRQAVVTTISTQKQTLEDIANVRQRLGAFKDDMDKFFQELKVDLQAIGFVNAETDNFRPAFKGDVELPLATKERAIEEAITRDTGTGADQYPARNTLRAINKKIAELEQVSSQDLAKKQKSLEIQKRITTIDSELVKLRKSIEAIDTEKQRLLTEKVEERWKRYLSYFDNLRSEQQVLENLYRSLGETLGAGSEEEKKSLEFYIKWSVDIEEWVNRGDSMLDKRKLGPYRPVDELANKAKELLGEAWTEGDKNNIREKLQELRYTFDDKNGEYTLGSQLLLDVNEASFDDWLFSTEHITLNYGIKYDGVELENLSPGVKGIVLLVLYLEMDKNDRRPLLIDQPEENLDNESIYKVLTGYFRKAKQRRQIIIITHNPNLVVNTDSEQVIVASFTKSPPAGDSKVRYSMGSLEDSRTDPSGRDMGTREKVCEILEGGEDAFHMREQKYAFDRR